MADIETVSVAADGTPIVRMEIIDKETGAKTPVNVSTCAAGVSCSKGITMEQHLANLYEHANNEGAHLTADEKAELETKSGAQEKATAAKNEAVAAASLLVENAKTTAAEDATNKANAARDAAYRYTDTKYFNAESHASDKGNPHNVTAEQVGLGKVVNKAPNDLQVTYTKASSLSELVSGERISVAFGKIAKAIADLIAHIGNKANPHGVTIAQIGAAPVGFGLGSGSAVKAVTEITANGWYVTNVDTPDGQWWLCHSFVTNNGEDITVEAWNLNGTKKCKRTKRRNAWGDWQTIWKDTYVSIVASGTSGVWTYRKWSDGTAECWSKQTLSCGLSRPEVTFNFPFSFTENPFVTMSAESMPIRAFVGTMRCYSVESNDEYDRYKGMVGLFQLSGDENATVSSVSGDVTFNVYCIGKWK